MFLNFQLFLIFKLLFMNEVNGLVLTAQEATNVLCGIDSKTFEVPPDYDILKPPPTKDGGPTRVDISVVISSIREVEEVGERLTLELDLRMYWQDIRLSHWANDTRSKVTVLNPKLLHKIWQPDLFIDNVISITRPSVSTLPASLKVAKGGLLRYSTRLAVTIAYTFNYRYFPADVQFCHIRIKSYAYKKDIVDLAWREEERVILIPGVTVHSFDTKLHSFHQFDYRNHSALDFTLTLSRCLCYHLVEIYIPSLVFVFISWLAFLMPVDNAPERIGCAMVTLLSLIVLLSSIGKDMPPVSYLTALHIWMMVCIIFVFAALIEFVIIFKLRSLENLLKEKNEGQLSERRLVFIKWIQNFDKWVVVVLPSIFLIFNLAYWPWLLVEHSEIV